MKLKKKLEQHQQQYIAALIAERSLLNNSPTNLPSMGVNMTLGLALSTRQGTEG